MEIYKIKKGLDIRLEGVAAPKTVDVQPSGEFALVPDDFLGVVPKVKVKEGEQVLVGTPLFVDKATEKIKFVSPVSGTVTAVERGDRRKVLGIVVEADDKQEYVDYGVKNVDRMSGDEVINLLLEAGLFGYINQLPYDVVACPTDKPKAIFVSALRDKPLAPAFELRHVSVVLFSTVYSCFLFSLEV